MTDPRIERIRTSYTYENQLKKFAEECTEAAEAALKHLDNIEDRRTEKKLAGEVADVLIMAEQMRRFIGPELVDRFIDFKLDRQLRRINGDEIEPDIDDELEQSFREGYEQGRSVAKHGHWKHSGLSRCSNKWLCSVCGAVAHYPFHGSKKEQKMLRCEYKLCPSCGAMMDEEA